MTSVVFFVRGFAVLGLRRVNSHPMSYRQRCVKLGRFLLILKFSIQVVSNLFARHYVYHALFYSGGLPADTAFDPIGIVTLAIAFVARPRFPLRVHHASSRPSTPAIYPWCRPLPAPCT